MKILFITHYNELYGANRSLIGLVENLGLMGVQAIVAVTDAEGDIAKYLNKKAIRTLVMPCPRWCGTYNNNQKSAFNPRRVLSDLRRKIASWRFLNYVADEILPTIRQVAPDIIYTNSAVTPLGYLIAKKLSLPHVWHLREYCDLDYNLKFEYGKFVSSFIISRSYRVICISQAIRRHYFRSSNKKAEVVYNGVYPIQDIEKIFSLHKKSERPTEIFMFLIVGLVFFNKQQEMAILAFVEARKKVKNIGLKIVGGGDAGYLARLKSIVETNNLREAVEFKGYTSDPSLEFIKADCFLMCSKHEGFGRVTAEAMASGLPVIGNNSGATPELIEHGVQGFLYDGSVADLANKMIYLAENRAESRRMGALGHAKAKKLYSTESNSNDIYRILLEVVNDSN